MNTNQFICDICNKSLSRPQDLKSHKTRFHKDQISAVDTQSTTQLNNEDILSESSEEFNEVQYQFVGDFLSHNQMFNVNDNISHLFKTRNTINVMPKTIVDIQYTKLKELIIVDQYFRVWNASYLPLFNQYQPESIDIQNRVTQGQPELINKVSLVDYVFDKYKKDDQQAQNFKLSTKPTIDGIIGKFVCENPVTFIYPEITALYWDIETFNTSHYGFPEVNDEHSHMSMICCVRLNHVKIWLSDKYTHDLSTIKTKLENHCKTEYFFEVIECRDDRTMATKFIEWLQQLKTFHYLCGFNATQGKSNGEENYYLIKPKCYDMNFIIKCAGLDTKLFKIVNQQWLNQKEVSYANYQPIPLVLFIDFKQLAQPAVALKEAELEGYKLNDILKLLGIPSKIEVDYIQMAKDSRIDKFDMSTIIAYCAYDCICLQMADIKHELFIQQYSVVQMLGLPLSTMCTLTIAKKLLIALLRKYYNNGYSFHYSSIDYVETRPKYGALTLSVDPKYQFRYLNKVASCDFTSQYPNAIKQMNISPENISATPTKLAVDIHYAMGEPNIVYFNDKEPILKQLVSEFLTLKAKYKSSKQTSLEKAAKLCANTIYGITNQDSCPIYNYYSASAITGFCRQSITEVKQLFELHKYNILSIDTDGIEVQAHDEVTETTQNIAKQINEKYNFMVLEIQENTEFIFNTHKKAYLKRTPEKLELKGFGSKNALSPYMRLQINTFCNNLMDSQPQSLDEILIQIALLKNRFISEIETCITKQQSLQSYTLFHKFTKQFTTSNVLTKSGKLAQRFGDKSVYNIIPFNYNESRKDYNYAEYSANLDHTQIQVIEIVNLIIQPLTQYFKLNNKTKTQQATLLEDQIVLAVETPGHSFINVDINQVESLVLANYKTCVYHEKILKNECKLYFDLETKKDEFGNLVMIDLKKFQSILHECLDQMFPTHIADGCIKNFKQSYHVVVDAIMTKQQMATLAKYINVKYGYKICDEQVYSADQNMRLPLQYKWNKQLKILTNYKLNIISNSRFNDFIVQNYTPMHHNLTNSIAFCNVPHFQQDNSQNQHQHMAVLTFLKDQFQLSCTISNGYIVIPNVKPYCCPLTKRMHKSQNLQIKNDGKVLCCFSPNCQPFKLDIPQPESNELLQKYKQIPLKNSQIVKEKQIKYDIMPYKYTYVKSQMNTGKTFHLRKQLALVDDYYQIVISFRRTFAQDFAQKMDFKNYQLIEGGICLRENKHVVIQIDSLSRLKLDGINRKRIVLVLDEIESILDQSQAFSYKPQVQISFQILVDLLQCSSKVIVLDALMKDRTIWLLNTIGKNDNYQVIHNLYQPKLNQTVRLIQDRHTNSFKADFQHTILSKLKEGQKVVSFCSVKELAQGIVAMAQNEGFTCKLYHGQDAKTEKCHDGKNMITAKTEDFKQLDLLTPDLLIYTSTLTAGISYEKLHFNSSVNYYGYNTCTPVQCIQALQRVRNITDTEVTLYLDTTQNHNYQQNSLKIAEHKLQAYDRFQTYDLIRELTFYLEARINEQTTHKNAILLDYLADQGYTIDKINKQYTTSKLYVVTKQIDYTLQIEEQDLCLPDLIKKGKFLINNTDTQLDSKLELIYLYGLYKNDMTLPEFNAHQDKAGLYSKKDEQIENLGWIALSKYFDFNHEIQPLTVEQACQFIKEREKQINEQCKWISTVQKTLNAKRRDLYFNKLVMIQHYKQLAKLDAKQVNEYVSKQNDKFVKVFNTTLAFLKVKIDNTERQKINNTRVRQYKLIIPAENTSVIE